MKDYHTEGPRIELRGNRTAVIEGCDGIIDYNDDKVLLKIGRLTAEISGKSLKLKLLTANSAVVEGFIHCIKYDFKRG